MDVSEEHIDAIRTCIGGEFCVQQFTEHAFLEEPYSVFLRVDHCTPGGLSLFKRIRETTSDVLIVWMSDRKQDAYTAFEYHADAFLLLPPTEHAIKDVLVRLAHMYSAINIQC